MSFLLIFVRALIYFGLQVCSGSADPYAPALTYVIIQGTTSMCVAINQALIEALLKASV